MKKFPQFKKPLEVRAAIKSFDEAMGYMKDVDLYLARVVDEWGGDKTSVARDMIKAILYELDLPSEDAVDFLHRTIRSYALEQNYEDQKPFRVFG